MITLAQAEVGKVYTVESVQADVQTKKHLNNVESKWYCFIT